MSAKLYQWSEEKAKRLALRTHTDTVDRLLGRSAEVVRLPVKLNMWDLLQRQFHQQKDLDQ